MDTRQDKIAIINAIEEASKEELALLAEIRDGLAGTTRGNGKQSNSSTGRVTRRLTQPKGEIQRTDAPQETQRRTYQEVAPPRRRKRAPVIEPVKRNPITKRAVNNQDTGLSGSRSGAANRKPASSRVKADKNAQANAEGPSAGNGRDSRGRFTSKDKSEQIQSAKDRKQEAKLNEGFLTRLGTIIGADKKRGAGDGIDASNAADVAGAAAGGPLWMAASGLVDVAMSTGKTALSMSKWLKDQKDGEKKSGIASAKPIELPSAKAESRPAPVMGQPRSNAAYSAVQNEKTVQAMESQTEQLTTLDQTAISKLDDIEESLDKLRKARTGDDKDGFSLGKFLKNKLFGGRFGGRGSRGRRGERGKRGRPGRDAKTSRLSDAAQELEDDFEGAGSGVGRDEKNRKKKHEGKAEGKHKRSHKKTSKRARERDFWRSPGRYRGRCGSRYSER